MRNRSILICLTPDLLVNFLFMIGMIYVIYFFLSEIQLLECSLDLLMFTESQGPG